MNRTDKGNKKDDKKVFFDYGRMKSLQEARLHSLVVL